MTERTYPDVVAEVAIAMSASNAWPAVFAAGSAHELADAVLTRLGELGFLRPACRNCGKPHEENGGFCSEQCFSAWLDRQDKAGLEHHVSAIKAKTEKEKQGERLGTQVLS